LKYIETSSTPHTNDQQDPSDLLDSFLPSKQLQDTILTNAFRALLAMSASVEEAEIHGDVPRKALPVSYRKKTHLDKGSPGGGFLLPLCTRQRCTIRWPQAGR
jgi:hypothetical protein